MVDLAADFRLKDASAYPAWYGEEHSCPELLKMAVFGLPELDRQDLAGARLVARRLLRHGRVPGARTSCEGRRRRPAGIVVDAASGVSGAGRKLAEGTQFCTVDEDFTAYGLLKHRHTPEMEQAIGAQLLFTPHLAPMNRGILATCYARPTMRRPALTPLDVLADAYASEPFVVVVQPQPVDQGGPRRQHRPPDCSLSTNAPAGWSPSAPSTTSSRVRPAKPSSAPTPSWAGPRPPASPGRPGAVNCTVM